MGFGFGLPQGLGGGTATDITGPVRVADGSAAAPAYSFDGDTDVGMFYAATYIGWSVAGTAQVKLSDGVFQPETDSDVDLGTTTVRWANLFVDDVTVTTSLTFDTTTILQSDAANHLAQRNGTTAQIQSLYNTWTDGSNYERVTLEYSGNIAYLQSTAAGTGTFRAFKIGTAGGSADLTFRTNGGDRWTMDGAAGHLLAPTDNSVDIGASGATRPRTGYFGTSIVSPLISAGDGSEAAPSITFTNDTNTGLWSETANEIAFSLNGGSVFVMSGSSTQGFQLHNGVPLCWGSGSPTATSADTIMDRQAAGKIAIGAADMLTIGDNAINSGSELLQVGTASAPTGCTADSVVLYSSDDAAGHTVPSFYCEGTNVLATGQADSASSVRVKMRINGTVVTLLGI